MNRIGISTWLALAPVVLFAQVPDLKVSFAAPSYEYTLFAQAMDATVDEYGPYRLVGHNLKLTEDRAVALLNSGRIDVVTLVLTPERETKILPIRVDLTRGLQGYRLFLIRKQDQSRFDTVTTLDDLRTRFMAGFGNQWGDFRALQTNKLPTVAVTDPTTLYSMLQGQRFDYFPRGVNEVWDNLAAHRAEAPDMVIERRLALYYPMIQCYEVAPTNIALATRIQKGLDILIVNGGMKKLFLQFYRQAIDQAALGNRKVFDLVNPELPTQGPTVDRTWWLGHP